MRLLAVAAALAALLAGPVAALIGSALHGPALHGRAPRGPAAPPRRSLSLQGHAAAAAGVAVATAASFAAERFPAGRAVTGPLASLGVAAALSNLGAVPAASPVYEWCWEALLPLSLSLTLIGQFSTTRTKDGGARQRRVGAAFAAGAVGSVAGAFAGYAVAVRCVGCAAGDAARAAACILASYVGGSANFFAVAKIVGLADASASLLTASRRGRRPYVGVFRPVHADGAARPLAAGGRRCLGAARGRASGSRGARGHRRRARPIRGVPRPFAAMRLAGVDGNGTPGGSARPRGSSVAVGSRWASR
ncbi:hypothetical protein M885DRAFT_92995 [Pelagophyceae sp. CCMP2097]|nr:hypothetical protein M885DRAFT_92995 [Pelagophyceae sp. CCMP2097]